MSTAEYARARRHLARRDAVLKQVIRGVGPCTLLADPDGFGVLVRSIISQLISTKAAVTIQGRLMDALKGQPLEPAALRRFTVERLRALGVSTAKAAALKELAEKAHGRRLPLDTLAAMTDEEVIARLVELRGVGRWTAEMFLIFSLGRLDVLPVGDLGFRAGVQREYGLAELPERKGLETLGEAWRPFRSVATWYLWRSKGRVPQSE